MAHILEFKFAALLIIFCIVLAASLILPWLNFYVDNEALVQKAKALEQKLSVNFTNALYRGLEQHNNAVESIAQGRSLTSVANSKALGFYEFQTKDLIATLAKNRLALEECLNDYEVLSGIEKARVEELQTMMVDKALGYTVEDLDFERNLINASTELEAALSMFKKLSS